MMGIHQAEAKHEVKISRGALLWISFRRQMARILVARGVALALVLLLSGRSSIPGQELGTAHMMLATAGHGYDFVAWEVNAIRDKLWSLFWQPAGALSEFEGTYEVGEYLARAAAIVRAEDDVRRLLAMSSLAPEQRVRQLQAEIGELRYTQQAKRLLVEQIIETQVSSAIAIAGVTSAGIVLPPVHFSFTSPPKKLIVSPRDRIETIYSRLLAPETELDDIRRIEESIDRDREVSAYITAIGGLGAYPSMVIDGAGLDWILSTVAHEWCHNYLSFFPLGLNYFGGSDLMALNETAAEIVGNEIGAQALVRFYPANNTEKVANLPLQANPTETDRLASTFDYRIEMRETRLKVDELLDAGKVEDAEAYMEFRRQRFVAQGYNLRILNQAYFAFHGSYGTSAASTSTIGPKMEHLRQNMPSLHMFLQTVREFTSEDDLDRALLEWMRSCCE
jgi:hypothetical protein